VVGSGGINAVLVRDDFPELGTDLVTALSSLNMNDLTIVLLLSKLKLFLITKQS